MYSKQGILSRLNPAGRTPRILTAPPSGEHHPQIHPHNDFLAHLERETLRAERIGQSVRLLVLDLVDAGESSHDRHDELDQLASILTACTRRSDFKGWHLQGDRWTIGLLMCQTCDEAIDAVLRKINSEMNVVKHRKKSTLSHSAEIIWKIHSFPREWTEPQNGIRQLSLLEDIADDGSLESPEQDAADLFAGIHLPARLLAMPCWKRRLDFAGSLTLILLLSPVLLLITLLIKLTSRGPVLFRQKRVGLNGTIFECLKFRTMRTGYDTSRHQQYYQDLIASSTQPGQAGKPMVKLDKRNPQITLVGRFLRPSHLDELPQLFNVLGGEMSLVGPRPCIPYEAERYQHWCRHRFESVPGITGLWQVKGKNSTTFAQMIRLDIRYILQRSLWLDLQILFMTIPTIVKDVVSSLKSSPAKEQNHANEA